MNAANEQPTQARWQQIEHLFLEAVARPADERAAFLASACAGDTALREDVAAMLAAHEEADDAYLEALDADRAAALLQETDADLVETIGPYRLVEELGRGGMGTVYLAERADGQFEQQVALKLVKRGMDSATVLRRFLAERQILARLQHPNVARLLDGGLSDDGRPYFAMERVDGRPITGYCDANRLSIEARLRLFEGVCEAVQYAHSNLVVHRDLKPSNILVTDEGQVKLLDFGIGKVLGGETDEQTQTVTEAGFRVMTPEYAAPEQVRGEAVTTATDVYSLGVVLYELLVGRRPYAFARRTPEEVARVITETEPERPSTAISQVGETQETEETISQRRATTASALRRRLSGDLDTVVLKALRKEPERRYASAEAFVEDVKRHLAGLPVTARPDTAGYRLRKFVGRHKVGVAAVLLVVLSLVVGLGVALWQAQVAATQRDLARQETQKAEQVADFMIQIFDAGNPSQGPVDSLSARELLDRGAERIGEQLAGQPDVQAQMLEVVGRAYRVMGRFDQAAMLLHEALTIRQSLYGKAHPDVAEVLFELAYVFHEQGAYAEADSLFGIWLAMLERVDIEEDAQQAIRQWRVGTFYAMKREYATAEPLLRAARRFYRETYGAEHEAVADIARDLATVVRDQGRHEEAIALLRESIAVQRTLHLEETQGFAATLMALGGTLWKQGHYAEAEAALRETVALFRALYGDEDYPGLASSLLRLARFLHEQERYEEAEAPYREATDWFGRRFGDTYVLALRSQEELADVLRHQGAFDEAETLLLEVVAAFQEQRGAQSPYTQGTLGRLTALYEAWGKEEAATRYRALLDTTVSSTFSPH